MRRYFCILAVLTLIFLSRLYPGQHEDYSYSIRRVYLDVLGIVPVPHEIDWYCIYNDNGYSLAVEWVLARPRELWVPGWEHMSVDDMRKSLFSDVYRRFKKMPLSRVQLNRQICYLAGETYTGDYSQVIQSRKKLIQYALESTDNDVDAFDNLAYQLMSRVTTMLEANYLKERLKEYRASSKDEQANWQHILDEMLGFEDIKSR